MTSNAVAARARVDELAAQQAQLMGRAAETAARCDDLCAQGDALVKGIAAATDRKHQVTVLPHGNCRWVSYVLGPRGAGQGSRPSCQCASDNKLGCRYKGQCKRMQSRRHTVRAFVCFMLHENQCSLAESLLSRHLC